MKHINLFKKDKGKPAQEDEMPKDTADIDPSLRRMTFSRISMILGCPMKGFYGYQAGGNGIELLAPFMPFIEGEFVHYALSHFHKSDRMQRVHLMERMKEIINRYKDGAGGIDPELDNKLQKSLAAMLGACLGYKQRYKDDKDKYETLYVEEPFQFEIAGFTVEGVIDWVARDKKSDQLIIVEHKTTSRLAPSVYEAMPMSFQDLLYCEGVKALTGEYPDAMMRNYVVKSALRRRKDKEGGMESLPQFETRVTQQYMDEPEKKFFRTPPVKLLKTTIKSVLAQLEKILSHIALVQVDPYMDFSACIGKYDTPCAFMPACRAKLQCHADGWNAPECRGLFREKEELHPEVERSKKGDK